ncbi:AAA family ATPase [Aeromonas hydrophila]|uniref:AAA family ATPase n=1 Tax=Aeromonas hydrophila TaxID=644 RepID=UPI001F6080DD|nr:AAA family ATPase [Aeromonas hydrophila]
MARYTEHDPSQILQTAETFFSKCLLQDGSLLFEVDTLWTIDVLQRLHSAFVAAPDEGDRQFTDKFRDQIKPQGQDVIRLAAELLCVYFLFPSNVGGARKRELINEVLSWCGDSLPDSHPVSRAFAAGIGSGGQGYNTRRPFELTYLINLVLAWKALPIEEQKLIANDPWLFQSFADSLEEADSRQLRHMLLYLFYPDHFERIASNGHKRRIVNAFGELVDEPGEDDNLDQRIYAIRSKLETLLPGKKLDFYWPPLVQAWFDNSDETQTGGTTLELIEHKKQIVLYGPPGTGKTYTAKKLAETIIRSAALRKWKPARYFQSEMEIQKALTANIHRLQLHPAYSYEDFIRALHLTAHGGTEYRLGYLPHLIEEINQCPVDQRLPHVLILDEMNRTDLSRLLGECFSLLEDREQSIELPGRTLEGKALTLSLPTDLFVIGTMNLIDQSIEQIDFALRRRFLWQACPFSADALMRAAESKWNALSSRVEWERIAGDFQRLADAASVLNQRIHDSPLLGAQYEIGHTYLLDVVTFLHNSLQHKTRPQNFLWTRKGNALEPVEQVWKFSLRPLLEQYLAGLDAKARNAELDQLEKVMLTSSVKV